MLSLQLYVVHGEHNELVVVVSDGNMGADVNALHVHPCMVDHVRESRGRGS